MGVWTNITRLAQAGSVQGAQNPGPTDVITPAQAVQVIDDVSHAVPPVAVPVALWNGISVAVVARSSAFEIRAAPNGTLIRTIIGRNNVTGLPANVDTVRIATTPVALANLAAVADRLVLGAPAPLSSIFSGDIALPISPADVGWRFGINGTTVDLFLAAGEVMQLYNATTNQQVILGFITQDIP